ncbi:type VI secretion system contractile sheath domain-containing protein [Oceanospirillum sediminis]|uniref:Type VI secretion system contractile sheath large subunit n=1 Tax=Oceanospirillum sediminis TaxID=2760088 RepID=A0A839INY5_9GAMM|nr:type VI secretion system contractile sheath large subunit [Oceanospirillum sediminis]MBB1486611.1 type VI secretion system contractile sheath large subunit [Oceanospirillum sediminis]
MFDQDWQQQFNELDAADSDYLVQALELIGQLNPDILTDPQQLKRFLVRMIAQLDQALSRQLSHIMHHDDFQALEARWRNLHELSCLPVSFQRIRIRMMNISWQEVSYDLNTANTTRSSVLYNTIGNRELNTLGGEPYNIIVVDHAVHMEMDFDDDYDDLYTLELLGQLGEAVLCPFILSVSDSFFGENSADWLSDTHRIEKILQGPDYQGWQRLRQVKSTRFLGLAMPDIQLRKPYQNHPVRFIFNEMDEGFSGDLRPAVSRNTGLWGSAAFAFASTVMREFNRISWFGFIKSRWQDRYQGALINLPESGVYRSVYQHPQSFIRLFGHLASFYSGQGFIPLSHSPLTNKYFFAGNNSVWYAGDSDLDKVSCQIQTTLMSCRIAHYLKVQIREMLGSYQTASECELHLSRWLDKYCSNVADADENVLAKYPLSKGRVTVKELPGESGRFSCEVLIKPQYQFDHFCGEMLLSTDLLSAS